MSTQSLEWVNIARLPPVSLEPTQDARDSVQGPTNDPPTTIRGPIISCSTTADVLCSYQSLIKKKRGASTSRQSAERERKKKARSYQCSRGSHPCRCFLVLSGFWALGLSLFQVSTQPRRLLILRRAGPPFFSGADKKRVGIAKEMIFSGEAPAATPPPLGCFHSFYDKTIKEQ